MPDGDSAHDAAHFRRVVKTALELSEIEDADTEIVEAAAWLHDCVILPKNHPERKRASELAAEKARDFLKGTEFPFDKIPAVQHAIKSHSYSAGIKPETIEAKIVQDADRLDALGAIGIARCFMVGGKLGHSIYNPSDPFCDIRQPDDSLWNVDHFYRKLFRLPDDMNTESAREKALERIAFMKAYLDVLKNEISSP